MRAHEEIINKELDKLEVDMKMMEILKDEGLKKVTTKLG